MLSAPPLLGTGLSGIQPGWGGNSGRTPALPGPWQLLQPPVNTREAPAATSTQTNQRKEGRLLGEAGPKASGTCSEGRPGWDVPRKGWQGARGKAPQPLPPYCPERCVKGKITSRVTWLRDLSDGKQHFLSQPWSQVLCKDTRAVFQGLGVSGQGEAAAPHLCQHRPIGEQAHPLPSQGSPAHWQGAVHSCQ